MNIMKKLLVVSLACLSTYSYSDTLKDRVNQYLNKAKQNTPGIGLVKNEVKYKGLKIKNFRFDTDENYTIVSPGQEIEAQFDYELDSSKIENLHLHHFIYGLYPQEPIGCLLHSLGLKDSEGTESIQFHAPEEKGVYRFQIYHSDNGLTFSGAAKDWRENKNSSNNTTIGIVVVE